MEDPLLHIDHHLPGIGLIPASIELLRRKPKLDDQIPRQVLRLDLAPLLPPQPDQGLLVGAHDDPSVRATDKMPSLHRTPSRKSSAHKLPGAPPALTSAQIRAARALIRWSAENLARESVLGVTTIRRAELRASATRLTAANDLAVRRALEAAGVEFIDESEKAGPGVRLKKPSHGAS